MSNLVFNARFIPQNSSVVSPTTFEVTGDVFDGSGQFSALDVSVGDLIFLDTFNSVSAPATVSRYMVDSIVSSNVSSVTAVLSYADTGTAVDPSEVLGSSGFACRSSLRKFAYHAASTIHTFPAYVADYARNYDSFINLENELDSISVGADAASIKGLFINGSGSTLSALDVVRQNSSGNLLPVDITSLDQVLRIVGVLTEETADGDSGLVVISGKILNVTTSYVIGDVLYLSKTGGFTTTAPVIGVESFEDGDAIVRIGQITKNSDSPANKDLLVKVEFVGIL